MSRRGRRDPPRATRYRLVIRPHERDQWSSWPAAAPEPTLRRVVRLTLFLLTLLGGITLAVVGLYFSARMDTEPFLDPTVPFSPVLFILGITACFYSAFVYETLPPVPAPREGPAERG